MSGSIACRGSEGFTVSLRAQMKDSVSSAISSSMILILNSLDDTGGWTVTVSNRSCLPSRDTKSFPTEAVKKGTHCDTSKIILVVNKVQNLAIAKTKLNFKIEIELYSIPF